MHCLSRILLIIALIVPSNVAWKFPYPSTSPSCLGRFSQASYVKACNRPRQRSPCLFAERKTVQRRAGNLPFLKCSESSLQGTFSTMNLEKADALLRAYDAKHQEVARNGSEGLGGGLTATKWADTYSDTESLRTAIMTMVGASNRVMMGFCASSAQEGIQALKAWVEELGLVKGRLHGMDKDGVPLDMSDFGAVYIKYNSAGGELSEPGDAMLNGYGGDFRGVYFAPSLADGQFRQFAVLPLWLFGKQHERSVAGGAPDKKPPQATNEWQRQVDAAKEVIASLSVALETLGARAQVSSFEPSTKQLTVQFQGQASLKLGIEDAIRAESGISNIRFVEF